KKKKDRPNQPTTIRESLAQESAAEVEISEAEVGGTEETLMPAEDDAAATKSAAEPDTGAAAAPTDPGAVPQDSSTLESKEGYLDSGAILVPAVKDQKVRLDIDQKSKRVVSLTIAVGQASIQLQAFSAPKSGGIWQDVRGQIEESV